MTKSFFFEIHNKLLALNNLVFWLFLNTKALELYLVTWFRSLLLLIFFQNVQERQPGDVRLKQREYFSFSWDPFQLSTMSSLESHRRQQPHLFQPEERRRISRTADVVSDPVHNNFADWTDAIANKTTPDPSFSSRRATGIVFWHYCRLFAR